MTREPASEPGAFVGVILAAGEGRRFQPFGGFAPKPLLPLLERSLLTWQIERLREIGISEVVIVIGRLGARVREAVGDGSSMGVRVEYVDQGEVLGIAHAVGRLEGVVDRPFVLLLGDVHFLSDDFGELLSIHARPDVRAVLAVKEESDDAALKRNFTVEADAEGRVWRVVEKPTRPRTRTKGCGQYVFDDSIFEAIRHTPRSALRNEYEITDAIQILIDGGGCVRAADVIRDDLNLATPADLLALNLGELARRGIPDHAAPDAVIDPEARVTGSIVLAGAVVEAGATLERCLVMPGERVGPGARRDAILVDGQCLGCR